MKRDEGGVSCACIKGCRCIQIVIARTVCVGSEGC